MRTFVLLFATFSLLTLGSQSWAQTVITTSQQQTYVCPKCGKVHVRSVATPQAAQPAVSTVSYQQPVAQSQPVAASSSMRARGGVVNVLANLNAQRARQGLFSLTYDPQLQTVAERRAQTMAASGYKNHPPGSFSPGRYEGVGWSSSYSPSKVSACFTSDTRMRYAGAAMATGRDGDYFAVVYR